MLIEGKRGSPESLDWNVAQDFLHEGLKIFQFFPEPSFSKISQHTMGHPVTTDLMSLLVDLLNESRKPGGTLPQDKKGDLYLVSVQKSQNRWNGFRKPSLRGC